MLWICVPLYYEPLLYSLVLNLQVGKLPLSTSLLPDDPCISTVGKTYPQSILTQTHVPAWRCSHPVHGVQIRAEYLCCPVNITSVHGFYPFGEPSCHLFYNFLLQRDLLLALRTSVMPLPAQLFAALCWTPVVSTNNFWKFKYKCDQSSYLLFIVCMLRINWTHTKHHVWQPIHFHISVQELLDRFWLCLILEELTEVFKTISK